VITPALSPVKRQFLGQVYKSHDIIRQPKPLTTLSPTKSKQLEELLANEDFEEPRVSKTPRITSKKDHPIGSMNSSLSISVLNLGEGEDIFTTNGYTGNSYNAYDNTRTVGSISSFGKIALRDDFMRNKQMDSPTFKLHGIKRTMLKGISLKSIAEEGGVNEDQSDLGGVNNDNSERVFDNYEDIVIGTESNKCLITENSLSGRNLVLNDNKKALSRLVSEQLNKKKGEKLNTKVRFSQSLKTLQDLNNKTFTKSVYFKKDNNSTNIPTFKGTFRERIHTKLKRKVTFSAQINLTYKLDKDRKRLKNCSVIQTILSGLSIILIIVDNELETSGDEPVLLYLRFINAFITLMLLLFMIFKLKLQNDIFKLSFSVVVNRGYTTYEYLKLIFEFLVCIIFIPPYIEYIMNYEFFINNVKQIISILCFFKLYYFFDQILLYSPFQYKKARFLRSLLNLDPSKKSLLQSWFHENRYMCLILFPFIFFPTISYLIMLAERVSEKDFYNLNDGNCVTAGTFFSYFWITGISFFTSKYIS
jgi:hypothetical protein